MKNKKTIIIILLLILIIFVFMFVFKDRLLKIIYPQTYKEVVSVYAEKYGIEENLIFAVIKAESNFNKDAVSNKKATGVMQLMEETAKDVAKNNNIEIDENNITQELCDVYKNIEIGTCYLSSLIQKYENEGLALAAYNAGTGNVDKWIQSGIIKKDGTDIENVPYKETNNYIRKILRDYKIYEDLYKN